MSNFICAVTLIAVVIIFSVVNSVIICNICDELTRLLDEGNVEKARDLWESKKGYLSFFIRDAEIDVVSSEAAALGESIALEDGEAELGALRFREAVEELRHGELPNIFNIF